jgi:hypothetical protein
MDATKPVSREAMTIGMDLGDRTSEICVLDAEGTVVETARIRTKQDAIAQRFAGATASRIALETGTHSPWVTELLQGLGHEVIVANPRKVRSIFGGDSKTDQFDAEQLARLARMGSAAAVADHAPGAGDAGRSRPAAGSGRAGPGAHADGEPRARQPEVVRGARSGM